MGVLTRMCEHCGFKVHAIADTEEEALILAAKLMEDNRKHKASCWFERLPKEKQNEIALKEILEEYDA